MTSIDERVAVLESQSERNSSDIEKLHITLRKHFEKEEELGVEMLNAVHEIKKQQEKQKSFVGGVVWTVTGVWVAGIAAWKILIGQNGGS